MGHSYQHILRQTSTADGRSSILVWKDALWFFKFVILPVHGDALNQMGQAGMFLWIGLQAERCTESWLGRFTLWECERGGFSRHWAQGAMPCAWSSQTIHWWNVWE